MLVAVVPLKLHPSQVHANVAARFAAAAAAATATGVVVVVVGGVPAALLAEWLWMCLFK
jgi:hypothetical protein